ncbi:MAG TPA: methylthioribulose 1-phosphate dehydratase [Vicinamibacterales bacterium]|nr:methylthioribulose 1-phosphate dehydratase [Vicinamibacterales bacterium]
MIPTPRFEQLATELADVGRRFYGRGWVLGTSGNLSAVLATLPLELCITPTGARKGELSAADFLHVDSRGRVRSARGGKPSAETALHLEIAEVRTAGAVLHTHSVWSTILSERHCEQKGLAIQGYEMLKGLDGVKTHEHREWIPIVENDQDMTRLAAQVKTVLTADASAHAFLISGHGLYTWGRTIADAERHVEILEFLLETQGRR